MKTKKAIIRELLWFVCITLIITYLIGVYLWNKGGLGNPVGMITRYVPALTVLGLYLLKFKRPILKNSDLGFAFKGFKYWLIAPLLVSALSFLSYVFSYFLNPEMFETAEVLKESLIEQGFYWGNSSIGFLVIVLINSLVGSLLNIPMFIGEELGWRGFLQPRLFQLFNPRIAFVIGGIVWAIWHAVMIALGLNYPEINPILGLAFMVIFCIPLGIIFQYFYVKSQSIFVAALAHAALNKSAMSMSFVLKEDSYNTLIYGPTGLIGIIIFGIVAFYLYHKIDWTKETTLNT